MSKPLIDANNIMVGSAADTAIALFDSAGKFVGYLRGEPDGSLLARMSPGSTWAYGGWPNSLSIPIQSMAASTATGEVVYQNDNVSAYDAHEITVHAGAGATTVQVFVAQAAVSGVLQYEAVPVQLIDRSLVEGAAVRSTNDIKVVGNYLLRGKFQGIRIVQTGGSITTAYAVRGRHGVM